MTMGARNEVPVLTRPRILIVDDELLVTQRICEIFRGGGYLADSALSGHECLRKLEADPGFDVIILDIDFGADEPDGGALAALIRDRHDIPIVFYTGHTDRATIGLTEASESFGIVGKAPDDGEILLAAASAAIRRWKAEQRVVEQSESYRTILDYVPLPIAVVDPENGAIHLTNEAGTELFGDPPTGSHDDAFVPADASAGEAWELDVPIDRAWTTVGPIVDRREGRHWLITSRDLPSGRTIKAHHDVDALCGRLRALESEVATAEALLRDVHHRVKNNLAIVDALVGATQERIDRPEALDPVRAQVRSVQLLHDRLHATREHSAVDIIDYLEQVARASLAVEDAPRLEVASDARPGLVSGSVALPLGLIVAEVVTNAQKHSFAPAQRHWVRVSLRRVEHARLELAVEFGGTPLPSDEELAESEGSGLELVRGLVRQLGASLSFERSPCNAVRVRFPNRNRELN
jgi:two-component sensor histidine kinase